ncbi:IS66 family transposase [Dyadobacter crusticola]|uniref:IS66 family transposase n=1 Tax=Dyadobacter crusticola TaxID=292407 RepID=UPI0035B66B38
MGNLRSTAAADRNNLAENVIRPLAIGRKTFLFAGSHQAAEMTAAMYSFMAPCKKNGVDEQELAQRRIRKDSITQTKKSLSTASK